MKIQKQPEKKIKISSKSSSKSIKIDQKQAKINQNRPKIDDFRSISAHFIEIGDISSKSAKPKPKPIETGSEASLRPGFASLSLRPSPKSFAFEAEKHRFARFSWPKASLLIEIEPKMRPFRSLRSRFRPLLATNLAREAPIVASLARGGA